MAGHVIILNGGTGGLELDSITATSTDILSGKVGMNSSGDLINGGLSKLEKTVYDNGTYTPDSNKLFSKVVVAIPVYSGAYH